jgi:hypothetical protein
MLKKHSIYLIALVVLIPFFVAGIGTLSWCQADAGKSFKDYPDNTFNSREYVRGMSKGGHNLLMWVDPSVDFSQYKSANVSDFGKRLLPVQTKFSYDPTLQHFNTSFKNNLQTAKTQSTSGLRIEGEMVECNPGSRGARFFVGYGAGKVAGAVACEVYVPGKSQPVIRIYARDTSSWDAGSDSFMILNNIFSQVAFRVAAVLDARIGK